MGTENKNEFLDQLSDYQYGFKDSANFVYRSKQGLMKRLYVKSHSARVNLNGCSISG